VCGLPFLLFGVLGCLVFYRLDGAGLGLKYMCWFDWPKLLEWKLWIDCFVQVVFQYFVGLAVYKNVKMILNCRGSKQFQDPSGGYGAVGLGPTGVCPEESFGKLRFLFNGILISFALAVGVSLTIFGYLGSQYTDFIQTAPNMKIGHPSEENPIDELKFQAYLKNLNFSEDLVTFLLAKLKDFYHDPSFDPQDDPSLGQQYIFHN
jgi:hypothetical protein